MNEALLQFIWQYSLYNPAHLFTASGEALTIIHQGSRNTNAGPDFTAARIKVGNTTLAGNIELHVKSSDWLRHNHQQDKAYHNIILHVVYEQDQHIDGAFPTLVIAPHIPAYIIAQYTNLIQTANTLPCGPVLNRVKPIVKESWLNRLLATRWEQKLGDWEVLLQRAAGDWRLLLYWRLAANFGFKINAAAFLLLAQSVPLNVLAKHHNNLLQVEAILFGQAGFLNEGLKDEYPRALKTEYDYLKKKYGLVPMEPHLWKFLRLRPANFPTIRIAQFAMLIHLSEQLFSKLIEVHEERAIAKLLNVNASTYWDTHFRFDDEPAKKTTKNLGKDSVENIIINTIAPIQFLYAHHHGLKREQELAIQLLETIPAENNNIVRLWEDNGWKPENAAHSQAMIQLFNNYCMPKRCLECSIGLSIVRSAPVE